MWQFEVPSVQRLSLLLLIFIHQFLLNAWKTGISWACTNCYLWLNVFCNNWTTMGLDRIHWILIKSPLLSTGVLDPCQLIIFLMAFGAWPWPDIQGEWKWLDVSLLTEEKMMALILAVAICIIKLPKMCVDSRYAGQNISKKQFVTLDLVNCSCIRVWTYWQNMAISNVSKVTSQWQERLSGGSTL